MPASNLINNLQNSYRTGNRNKIKATISMTLKDSSTDAQVYLMCAKVAAKMGEVNLAKEAIIRFAQLRPQNKETQLTKASFLAELGQVNSALDYILEHSDLSAPDIQHFIGTVKSQIGEIDQALGHFRQVLRNWTNSGQTWQAIAALKIFNESDPDFQALCQASGDIETTHPLSQAAFQYAMAKAHHDIDDYPTAEHYYQLGGKFMEAQGKYHPLAEKQIVDTLLRSFNKTSLDELAENEAKPRFSPIFVLGLPRSGTTLIERVISSHSKVMAGGEVGFMQNIAMDLGGISAQHARNFEQQFSQPQDAWQSLSTLYAHLVQERFGSSGTIVDKTLGNSRYLGLISRMFPYSPKIWIRRNPLDTALSCFRTFFSGAMDWSWSWENIAHHFTQEDRLFQHWCQMFREELLVVPYEEFVTSPQLWTRKVLSHCGLSYERTFDSFHLNKRATTTASVSQVRRPVYQTSIGVSEHYSSTMRPFAQFYRPAVT